MYSVLNMSESGIKIITYPLFYRPTTVTIFLVLTLMKEDDEICKNFDFWVICLLGID